MRKSDNVIFADLCKIMLRDNRGVAFTVTPSEGMLEPYEAITVTVMAYSDMWGVYTDVLVCEVCRLVSHEIISS